MKRLHVHVKVNSLQQSIDYYETLFGEAPTVRKDDYAKWMLEDPRINFAISPTSGETGIDHLGLQVDGEAELSEIADRLEKAKQPLTGQDKAACCYALSDKAWSRDPQGVVWENFLSLGQLETKGGDGAPAEVRACCDNDKRPAEEACCS